MERSNYSVTLKAVLLIASSMTVMAGATIAPSLPQISKIFAEQEDAEFLSKLVLTLPALFIAIFAPVAGWLADKVGRKKLLIGALVLYAISGTTGLYLNDLYHILIGRAFLGLSIAGVMTAATTLIADYFEGVERNKFMGLQGAFMSLGGVVYVSAGGVLADLSWRSPFLLYFAALILIPFAASALFEPARATSNAVQNENKQSAPRPTIALIFVLAFLSMVFFYMIPVQIPFLLNEMTDVNNAMVGLSIAVTTLASASTALNYQRVRKHLSYQSIFGITFILMAMGYAVISLSSEYWQFLLGLILSGFGLGFLMPNTSLWTISLAPEHQRGRIIGLVTSAFYFGQFLSPVATEFFRKAGSLSMAFGLASMGLATMALSFFIYVVIANKAISRSGQ